MAAGSSRSSASEMVDELCTASTRSGELMQATAQWWKDLKGKLHGSDLPGAFDPRVRLFFLFIRLVVGMLLSYTIGLAVATFCRSVDLSRDAIVQALKKLRQTADSANADTNADSPTEDDVKEPPPYFVFLLADIDGMSDFDAERWLKWTHDITSNGLAHVVAPTQRAITPTRLEWLQARHHANHRDGDFVAILLRVAKDAVDRTNAEQKVSEAAVRNVDSILEVAKQALTICWMQEALGFELLGRPGGSNDEAFDSKPQRESEIEIIARTTGNWWGDVLDVCNRLVDAGLPALTDEQVFSYRVSHLTRGSFQLMV